MANLPTKYPGFQFHGSDTIFKLMNGSFLFIISFVHVQNIYRG